MVKLGVENPNRRLDLSWVHSCVKGRPYVKREREPPGQALARFLVGTAEFSWAWPGSRAGSKLRVFPRTPCPVGGVVRRSNSAHSGVRRAHGGPSTRRPVSFNAPLGAAFRSVQLGASRYERGKTVSQSCL